MTHGNTGDGIGTSGGFTMMHEQLFFSFQGGRVAQGLGTLSGPWAWTIRFKCR